MTGANQRAFSYATRDSDTDAKGAPAERFLRFRGINLVPIHLNRGVVSNPSAVLTAEHGDLKRKRRPIASCRDPISRCGYAVFAVGTLILPTAK